MNALHTIQQKLKAPKCQYNSFGKYHYRNAEDILEAVKPLLGETKATLILDDNVTAMGSMVFVVATATLTDEEGKSWSATAYARHAEELKGMQDSQVSGATSSYARKYALNGLFLIDDTKDADATNDGTKSDKKEKPKTTPATTPAASANAPAKKEWLNPGTSAWTHALERMKSGMKIEDVKKFFLISKANEEKLIKESTNENAPLA